MLKVACKSLSFASGQFFFESIDFLISKLSGGPIHGGIFLACQHNIRDTFEMDGSKVFNDLPKVCRDCGTYKSFCRETKKHFMDRALARSYQNEL